MVFFIFLGCSALGETLEDKTITYDLICPLPRSAVYLGRFAAYAVSTSVILLPVLLLAYGICMIPFGMDAVFRSLPILLAVALTTFMAAMVYGSVYIALSLMIKRAIFLAIILAVAVDGFLAYLPLRVATISPQLHFRNLAAFLAGEELTPWLHSRWTSQLSSIEPGCESCIRWRV